MMFVIYVVVLFLTCILQFDSASSESEGKLIFVSVVFRHGNRAPLVYYKNDPHKHSFPDGVGQLTKMGKAKMYHKGKLLRQMYDGLISPNYREDEIYSTSTVMGRTLMSAQLVLAGIYPPSDSYHHFEPHLSWQPIPVHEDSPDKSRIIGNEHLCPRYIQLYHEQLNRTTEELKERGVIEELLSYCAAHSGEELKTMGDLGQLVDALKSEFSDGLELPRWAAGYYDPTLVGFLDLLMNVIMKTTEQKRLITGPLLKQIIDNMIAKSKRKLNPDRNMMLYFGHDFTILGLLGSITKSDKIIPQPECGSSVNIELYRTQDDEHIVKVKYLRGSKDNDPEDISIPDCGTPCHLEKFTQMMKYAIPEDWEAECHSNSHNNNSIGHAAPLGNNRPD